MLLARIEYRTNDGNCNSEAQEGTQRGYIRLSALKEFPSIHVNIKPQLTGGETALQPTLSEQSYNSITAATVIHEVMSAAMPQVEVTTRDHKKCMCQVDTYMRMQRLRPSEPREHGHDVAMDCPGASTLQ